MRENHQSSVPDLATMEEQEDEDEILKPEVQKKKKNHVLVLNKAAVHSNAALTAAETVAALDTIEDVDLFESQMHHIESVFTSRTEDSKRERSATLSKSATTTTPTTTSIANHECPVRKRPTDSYAQQEPPPRQGRRTPAPPSDKSVHSQLTRLSSIMDNHTPTTQATRFAVLLHLRSVDASLTSKRSLERVSHCVVNILKQCRDSSQPTAISIAVCVDTRLHGPGNQAAVSTATTTAGAGRRRRNDALPPLPCEASLHSPVQPSNSIACGNIDDCSRFNHILYAAPSGIAGSSPGNITFQRSPYWYAFNNHTKTAVDNTSIMDNHTPNDAEDYKDKDGRLDHHDDHSSLTDGGSISSFSTHQTASTNPASVTAAATTATNHLDKIDKLPNVRELRTALLVLFKHRVREMCVSSAAVGDAEVNREEQVTSLHREIDAVVKQCSNQTALNSDLPQQPTDIVVISDASSWPFVCAPVAVTGRNTTVSAPSTSSTPSRPGMKSTPTRTQPHLRPGMRTGSHDLSAVETMRSTGRSTGSTGTRSPSPGTSNRTQNARTSASTPQVQKRVASAALVAWTEFRATLPGLQFHFVAVKPTAATVTGSSASDANKQQAFTH